MPPLARFTCRRPCRRLFSDQRTSIVQQRGGHDDTPERSQQHPSRHSLQDSPQTPIFVSNYERGQRRIDVLKMLRIVEGLKGNPRRVFGGILRRRTG